MLVLGIEPGSSARASRAQLLRRLARLTRATFEGESELAIITLSSTVTPTLGGGGRIIV